MKFSVLILFIIFVSMSAAAQQNKPVTVPKAADIAQITFDRSTADSAVFTRRSLLAVLPLLAPGVDPYYGSDTSGQKGTFKLRDGTVLEWWSCYPDSLEISDGKTSRLFFAVAQEVDQKLSLPDVADISKISFSSSQKTIYTRASLLKIIPQMVPLRAYLIVKIKQRGRFTLKNGSLLQWATGDEGQLVIYDGVRRILYGTYSHGEMTLPKVEDVKEIQAEPSDAQWFTPQSLLAALPKFVPGGRYQPKMIWQNGSIELKDGTILTWRAGSDQMLVLYTRGSEKYFRLPSKTEKSEPAAPNIFRK